MLVLDGPGQGLCRISSFWVAAFDSADWLLRFVSVSAASYSQDMTSVVINSTSEDATSFVATNQRCLKRGPEHDQTLSESCLKVYVNDKAVI